ncbi:S1C family serine protease [Deinococcus hopiensis]|nr:trypsin-like peptidase domain-containing protein [Deinococcus hopiensis]
MKRRVLAVTLVLLGLGLGATVLRDAVPVSDAWSPTGETAQVQAEAASRLQNEQNTMDIVRRYEPGLVYISTEQEVVEQNPMGWMFGQEGQREVQRGVGSGFFVNEGGDILTNYHVVAGEGGGAPDPSTRIQVRVMNAKEGVPARIIGLAPQYDLALIRPEGLSQNEIKPIPLGDSARLGVGQKAIAMGAPFGLDFSVTEGIVSSTQRQIPIGFSATGQGITQKAIQTDAAINPGNSGGPLLDSSGRVIGINTQIYSPSGAASGVGQNAGIGFAIPINTAKNLLPRLQAAKGGAVSAPRIGIQPGLVVQGGQGQIVPVGLSTLTAEGKRQLGLPDSGLVVGKVTPGSPAANAGLRGGSGTQDFRGGQVATGGDVIVGIDGAPVDALEDLQAALIDKREGDSVTLKVSRAGKARDVKVTLDGSSFQ